MTTALRLLVMLPTAPRLDAVHGGGRVQAQFLAAIVARHDVAVVCFRDDDEPGADPFFVKRCAVLEEVVRPASRRTPRARRYVNILGSLIRLRPVWVDDWRSKRFSRRVRAVAATFQPEIIQCESHVMAQYLSGIENSDARRVLVQHEPGARAAPYLQGLPPPMATFVRRIERISWQRYEADAYRRVDALVVFTDADRQAVGPSAGQTPVYVIPPGTVISEPPPTPLADHPSNLLFVGNFIHPPNVEAARRLVESILPAVRSRVPEVELFIVGDHPPDDVARGSGSHVIVTGRVADITPYLDRAAVVVAPMRTGGGMRIKVLEALAAGKAVVATPLAIEGLALTDGRDVAVAADDDEFADRVVDLLQDERKRLSMAAAARAWARERLGWDKTLVEYEGLYARLIGAPIEPRKPSGPAWTP